METLLESFRFRRCCRAHGGRGISVEALIIRCNRELVSSSKLVGHLAVGILTVLGWAMDLLLSGTKEALERLSRHQAGISGRHKEAVLHDTEPFNSQASLTPTYLSYSDELETCATTSTLAYPELLITEGIPLQALFQENLVPNSTGPRHAAIPISHPPHPPLRPVPGRRRLRFLGPEGHGLHQRTSLLGRSRLPWRSRARGAHASLGRTRAALGKAGPDEEDLREPFLGKVEINKTIFWEKE